MIGDQPGRAFDLLRDAVIITAYLPLFGFEHAEGKLFKPMAFTVGYALFGALLATLMLIPGLAYLALRKPRMHVTQQAAGALAGGITSVLGSCLEAPVVYAVCLRGALVGVLVLGADHRSGIPARARRRHVVVAGADASGLSLDKASEMTAELRRVMREFPEVSYVVTQLGRNDTGTDPWTPSHVEAGVGLKPYDSWPRWGDKAAIPANVQCPHAADSRRRVGISQPIVDGENDMIGGAHSRWCYASTATISPSCAASAIRSSTCCMACEVRPMRRSSRSHRFRSWPLRRSRRGGALRHQCRDISQSDPDRHRRCAGHPGLCRRPRLQRDHASIAGYREQSSRRSANFH